MAGPQRSEPEEATDAVPQDSAGLPSFDLEIAPLRPLIHAAQYAQTLPGQPQFGPLPRGRYKPAGLTDTAAPDTSPAGRALDALAALLAAPLGQPIPAAPVTDKLAAKIIVPDSMAVLDMPAGEPEVAFATTTVDYAPVGVAAPVVVPAQESAARATMALQRAAFDITESLPDLLPQLRTVAAPAPRQDAAPHADFLPFGSVTYRLFVM